MARVSTVICTSHSPFLFAPPEQWEHVRQQRAALGGYRADVPVDSPETNEAKFEQCQRAFGVLAEKLRVARPEVLIVFGDDQKEQFNFTNFPALSLFVGESFEGFKVAKAVGLPVAGAKRESRPRTPDHWTRVANHPELARHLLTGLVRENFDLAFSHELPNQEEGIGHAFMRPSSFLRPEFDLPTIPFFVNCYYGPQPTGKRCYTLGLAIRRLIDAFPDDVNVAVIGSGGLWHTPGAPGAYLDEEFDRAILAHLSRGEAQAAAECFDAKGVALIGEGGAMARTMSGGTGLTSGLGSGTGETRNWLIAAAVADGAPATIVDYVPVYASPCGMAFAHWEKV